MFNLDRWDVALLAVAGYIAVVSLSRMMARHRDRFVTELQQQAVAEQSASGPRHGKRRNWTSGNHGGNRVRPEP